MANPTLLDMPIARDGNKNTIPTTDNGTTGRLSQQYGWQLINAIPPQQGGKAVKREDFNGALYLLSNLLFYLQKGWQFEWNSSQAYYAGCIVKDTSDGKMYMCLNDVTSITAPHSDKTNWKLWDLSAYLPLSGGSLQGDSAFIGMSSNTSGLLLRGGTDWANGKLILYGRECYGTSAQGGFDIIANKDSAVPNVTLAGRPNGVLGWNNHDLGGSAIVAKSFTSDVSYIKYACGLILQEMVIQVPEDADVTDYAVSLPISFSGTTYSVSITLNNTRAVQSLSIARISGSQITIHSNTSLQAKYYHIIAIGY